MLYFVFSVLGLIALICALLFLKKERKVFKENKNSQNVLKEVTERIKEIERACPACEFERKHGKPHNLRPVHDLSIHTCGQVICPKCVGLRASDPCSLCNETGRVSEAKRLEYLPVCGTEFSKFTGKKWEAPIFWACSLKKGHKGECKP